MSILNKVKPPTREPDAGDPPVRFGGRGETATSRPYPYQVFNLDQNKVYSMDSGFRRNDDIFGCGQAAL